MTNKVLYFPYIRVPKSKWLTRMLLYWDQVGSIIPYDYIEDPERLDEHTRTLVKEELVAQIIPGMYVEEIPNFVQAFRDYLHTRGAELDLRRETFAQGRTFQIHIEKMGDLAEGLVELNLARASDYPWYHVEVETADDFMSYLATALGRLDEVQSIPVTDTQQYISRYMKTGVAETDLDKQLESLRLEVLENIFPAPEEPLSAEQIRNFKDKHGDKLSDFRRAVERELTVLADIEEPALRKRRLDLFYEEAEEKIEEIRERMKEGGFGELALGKFCAILAAMPDTSPIFGLANALYNAFGGSSPQAQPSYFAYAAYAQAELFDLESAA